MNSFFKILIILILILSCTNKETVETQYKVEEIYIPTDNTIADFDFIDENKVIAVGSYSSYYISYDKGINWGKHDFNESSVITCVEVITEQNIIMAKQSMYKTTNQGEDWSLLSNWTSNITDLLFLTQNTGFACMGALLYRSDDGGVSWNNVITEINGFMTLREIIFPRRDLIGYTYGGVTYDDVSNGILYKTIDGGNTWNRIAVDLPEITSMFFFNDSTGIMFTVLGKVLKTIDYGENWTALSNDCICAYPKTYFFNQNEGILTCYNNIYSTGDGGKSWTKFYTTIDYISNLKFISDGYGIAVGAKGLVIIIKKEQ